MTTAWQVGESAAPHLYQSHSIQRSLEHHTPFFLGLDTMHERIVVVIDPTAGVHSQEVVACAVHGNGDLLLAETTRAAHLQHQLSLAHDAVRRVVAGRDPESVTLHVLLNVSPVVSHFVSSRAAEVFRVNIGMHWGQPVRWINGEQQQRYIHLGEQQVLPENRPDPLAQGEIICVGLCRELLGL